MKKLYTLHVGINDYDPKIGKLNGCIKDLDNLEKLVNTYYAGKYQVEPRRLADHEATYHNIIEQFRAHLCQAGPDDLVWFHYSGHGSEEWTAEEFWQIEPKGKDQTLVCYDSGFGAQNLADKELAVLLHEVASQYPDGSPKDSPHIVVTLDCCHSGSGTRSTEELRPRTARAIHSGYRDFRSYVDGYYSQQGTEKITVPLSRHIVLSACENIQYAGDLPEGGVFTTGLTRVLRQYPDIDYVDLFHRVKSSVLSIRKDQNPQFNAIGSFNPYTKFMDGSPGGSQERYVVAEEGNKWYVECGAIHGLPTTAEHKIELDIYSLDNELKGGAELETVGALRSPIDLDTSIDLANLFRAVTSNKTEYRAQLKHLPAPPEFVYVHGNAENLQRLTDAWLNTRNVKHTDELSDMATLDIQAFDDHYEIYDHQMERRVYSSSNTSDESIGATLKALDKIVKWRRFILLENNRSTLLRDIEFEVEITSQDNPDYSETFDANEIKLYANTSNSDTLDGDPGFFQVIPKIKVKDDSQRPKLYFYTFFLDENYCIDHPDEVKNYRLDERPEGGYEQVLWNEFWFGPEPYNSHETCWVKLLVTTRELDHTKFVQEGIEPDRNHRGGRKKRGTKMAEDWLTFTMQITVARDTDSVPRDTKRQLSDSRLTILPHQGIDAKVSVVSTNQVTRGSDPAKMFDRMQAPGFEMVDFNGTGKHRENVIELREINTRADLKTDPLQLELNVDSGGDMILPVVFDGNMFRAAGDSAAQGAYYSRQHSSVGI